MSVFFCPGCWREVSEAARSCPACGADLEAFDRASPFFAAQIARALIEIGGEEARVALAVIARDPSIIVRRAARARGSR